MNILPVCIIGAPCAYSVQGRLEKGVRSQLGLQIAVNHHVGVIGIEPVSSEGSAIALNQKHLSIFPNTIYRSASVHSGVIAIS